MMKMARTNIVLGIKDDEEKSDYLQDILIDSGGLQKWPTYIPISNGTMDAFGSIISNNLNGDETTSPL